MTAPNGSNERPGGWVEGIGWVANFSDIADGDTIKPNQMSERTVRAFVNSWSGPSLGDVVIVTRWSDGTVPSRPSPVEDGRPDTAAMRAHAEERISHSLPTMVVDPKKILALLDQVASLDSDEFSVAMVGGRALVFTQNGGQQVGSVEVGQLAERFCAWASTAPRSDTGDEGLRALTELSEAATGGPWHLHRDADGAASIAVRNPDNPNPGVCGYGDWDGCLGVFDVFPLNGSPSLPDAEFIAAAVNYVRSLLDAHPSPGTGDGRPGTGALVALAHEGGSEHVPSVDVCAFCWDSECDGVVCISNLDPDDPDHHDSIERLHHLLRAGHALLAPSPGTGDDGSGTAGEGSGS